MKRPALTSASQCLFAIVLLADPAMAEDSYSLSPVIVTDKPVNRAAELTPYEETSVVRVVDREQFENRTTSLADALSNQTGVQVRQSGGLGSYSTVALRGTSGKQVQVYLDGMLLNDPLYGAVDLSFYTLHDVRGIQVYPGNAPARFAQAGVGGIVAMESMGEQTRDQTRINVGVGSFDTRRYGLFNSGQHDRFHYWFSLNRQQAENDYTYPNEPQWFNPTDGAESTRRNADVTQDDASLKAGYRFTPERQLDALLQWADKDKGIPSIQNWESNRARLETEQQRIQLHYQDSSWWSGRLHSSHQLLIGETREEYQDLNGRVGTRTYDLLTEVTQTALNNSLTWKQDRHQLSAALDANWSDMRQQDRLLQDADADRERRFLASALSHEWHSKPDRLRTQLVVRQYDVRDDSDRIDGNNVSTPAQQSHRYRAWQSGARLAITDFLWLYANLAQQVRVPTLVEQYGQQGLFNGNPDLEAEESLNGDISARWLLDKGHLEITGFQRHLEPAITAIYDARGVGRYINVEAKIEGIELEAQYDLLESWTLTANATFQDSENRSDQIADQKAKRLPGIYHREGTLSSLWRLHPVTVDLSWHYADQLYYDSANLLKADPQDTLNAAMSWQHNWSPTSSTELRLEARNITDALYQDFNRFPNPGRGYFINLQHTF